MKTDIYKIKTDQAWNRLYNRLDNDRLLAKVDEGHHTRKYSQWIRYGAVAAVLIGVIWGTLYWVTGSDKELAQHLLTQESRCFHFGNDSRRRFCRTLGKRNFPVISETFYC